MWRGINDLKLVPRDTKEEMTEDAEKAGKDGGKTAFIASHRY